MTVTLDLAVPLRAALIEAVTIGPQLAQYVGEPAVFTRRPVPADATMPFALINPPAAIGDADYLNEDMPIVMRDVIFYGAQPADFVLIEELGYAARLLFHRQKWAITPEGYDVVSIVARGPIPGPTDDKSTVARVVGLTIQLRRQR